MNFITAKIIRISCRVFDDAVNFIRTYNPTASKNKNNFRGMTRSQIEGDLVIEDKTGILIAGSATAKETIKNTPLRWRRISSTTKRKTIILSSEV